MHLVLEGREFVANILHSALVAEFAFYVYRNEQRIHTQWYTKSPTLRFDACGAPGYYRVGSFLRTQDGAIQSKESNPVFANPVTADSKQFPEVDPSQLAYELRGQHWTFPALYYPSSERRLFVMLPSAVVREKVTLPAFNRWTWASKRFFPGEVICVADPTIAQHDELNLGWCIGDLRHCATADLARFIVEFAAAKGIENRDIVTWGSSAGGFGALALASTIEGSTAVSINAQTDLLAYEIRRQVALVRHVCFDDRSVEEIRRDFGDRVDMTKRWSTNRTSRAFVIQNDVDMHHYSMHFKPFWQGLGGRAYAGHGSVGRHAHGSTVTRRAISLRRQKWAAKSLSCWISLRNEIVRNVGVKH